MKPSKNSILNSWGTWNVAGINLFSSAATGLEVSFVIRHGGRRLTEVRNHNLKQLRHYSLRHSYYQYTIQFEDSVVDVTVAGRGKTIVFIIEPRQHPFDFFIEGAATGVAGRRCGIDKQEETLVATVDDREAYAMFFVQGDTSIDERVLLQRPEGKIHLVVTPYSKRGSLAGEAAAEKFVGEVRSDYLKATARPRKALTESARLAAAGANLTTAYLPDLKHIATTSSREWCMGPIWGGWVIFTWDCFMYAWLVALESEELACENILVHLSHQGPNGMLAGALGKNYVTYDRPLPPIESFSVRKLYHQFKNKSFVAKCYPHLRRSLDFYMRHLDGNGDGLYEAGVSLTPKLSARHAHAKARIDRLLPYGVGWGDRQGAIYCSGMDNSPAFDDAEFDASSQTLKHTDIAMNSLIVLEAQCLAELAGVVGRSKDVALYNDFADQLKERIGRELWDEKAGIFKSRTWDGEFVEALTPGNFFPLHAGIATEAQAKRMVHEHLLNREEFWGDYVIPTIARNHPAFEDQNYWRGRIWGPTNYLVFSGLVRYGFKKVAREFAEKSHQLFMKEFKKDSHIHENYNAITGDGDDVNQKQGVIASDAFYPWGAVMLLPKLEL
jgi:hypothetical protein